MRRMMVLMTICVSNGIEVLAVDYFIRVDIMCRVTAIDAIIDPSVFHIGVS